MYFGLLCMGRKQSLLHTYLLSFVYHPENLGRQRPALTYMLWFLGEDELWFFTYCSTKVSTHVLVIWRSCQIKLCYNVYKGGQRSELLLPPSILISFYCLIVSLAGSIVLFGPITVISIHWKHTLYLTLFDIDTSAFPILSQPMALPFSHTRTFISKHTILPIRDGIRAKLQ